MISTEIWRHVESFDDLTPLSLFEHVRGYSRPVGLAHTELWDTISNMDDRELRAYHVGLHAIAVAEAARDTERISPAVGWDHRRDDRYGRFERVDR